MKNLATLILILNTTLAYSQMQFGSIDFSAGHRNLLIGSYVLPNGNVRCFWVPSTPQYGYRSDTAMLTDFNTDGVIVRQKSLGVKASEYSNILPRDDGSAILFTFRVNCDLISFTSIGRIDTSGSYIWLRDQNTNPGLNTVGADFRQLGRDWLLLRKDKVHLETGEVEAVPGWPVSQSNWVFGDNTYFYCKSDSLYKFNASNGILLAAEKLFDPGFELYGFTSLGSLVVISQNGFEFRDTSALFSLFEENHGFHSKSFSSIDDYGFFHTYTGSELKLVGDNGTFHEIAQKPYTGNMQSVAVNDRRYIFQEQYHPGFNGANQLILTVEDYLVDSIHIATDVAITDMKLIDPITWNFTPHPSPWEPPGRAANFGRLRVTIQNLSSDTIKSLTLSYFDYGCPTFCPFATYTNERFDQLSIAPGVSFDLITKSISVRCTESDLSKICLTVTKPNDKPDKNLQNNYFCADALVHSDEITQDVSTYPIEISPNPSTGFVNISSNLGNLEKATVLISDFLGQCVYTENNVRLPLELNLSILRPGLYQVMIMSESQFTSKDLVIMR